MGVWEFLMGFGTPIRGSHIPITSHFACHVHPYTKLLMLTLLRLGKHYKRNWG